MLDGARLSREEGIALLRDGDFLELGALADAVRWRKHPEPVVTYIIDRNINYTNVCAAQCAFCAFYRDLPSKEGYVLTKQELSEKIEETIALVGARSCSRAGATPTSGSSSTGALPLDQGDLPDLDPWPVPGGGQQSRGLELPLKNAPSADGRGARPDPGRGGGILSDRVRRILGIARARVRSGCGHGERRSGS